MAIQDFGNYYFTVKHKNSQGQTISVQILNESQVIAKNKFLLKEIPDSYYKVLIDGYIEKPLGISSLTDYQFTVDYNVGEVTFNPSQNGKTITIAQYYGIGGTYIYPNRIVGTFDEASGTVTSTFADIATAEATRVINENLRITNENTRITNESTRETNEANRETGYTNMVNSGIIIWKLPVSSFSSLASTYPSPTIGFTAQTTSDGKVFRFNGSEWAYIFTTSTSNNINYLWIEEKTINAGSNSFTLTNSVTTGQKLTVVDKKYGVEWIEGVHWNRSSSVVTLTESSLVETLTFRIINWG